MRFVKVDWPALGNRRPAFMVSLARPRFRGRGAEPGPGSRPKRRGSRTRAWQRTLTFFFLSYGRRPSPPSDIGRPAASASPTHPHPAREDRRPSAHAPAPKAYVPLSRPQGEIRRLGLTPPGSLCSVRRFFNFSLKAWRQISPSRSGDPRKRHSERSGAGQNQSTLHRQ